MTKNWTVLLIGGSSASGKSYLSRQLSQHYNVPLTEVDDIRIALQQIADPTKHADLFFFLNNPNYLHDFEIRILIEKLLAVGRGVWPALDSLIEKHLACNEPVIFEGDGIIPNLLATRDLKQVKLIILYDDAENLLERTSKRNRLGKAMENIEKQADLSYQFGQLIREQAEKIAFITIPTSPTQTLLERTLDILE